MTAFNPLATSILGSVAQQRQLAIEKNRRARRAQTLQKNIATEDEQLNSEVESADPVHAIEDEEQQHQLPRRFTRPHAQENSESDTSHGLDVTG